MCVQLEECDGLPTGGTDNALERDDNGRTAAGSAGSRELLEWVASGYTRSNFGRLLPVCSRPPIGRCEQRHVPPAVAPLHRRWAHAGRQVG